TATTASSARRSTRSRNGSDQDDGQVLQHQPRGEQPHRQARPVLVGLERLLCLRRLQVVDESSAAAEVKKDQERAERRGEECDFVQHPCCCHFYPPFRS